MSAASGASRQGPGPHPFARRHAPLITNHSPRTTQPPNHPTTQPPPRAENGLGFFLFLLLNLALFVRPADLHPSMVGIEFYLYVILTCFAVSFPAVMARLSPVSLEKHPIDVCVLMMLPAVLVSNLVGARLSEAMTTGFDFFKFVVYYLLFVALVTTPGRLRVLSSMLVVYATVMTLLSILDFYHFIRLPRVVILGREQALEEGRMYGPGIFSDPNDVCVIITVGILLLLAQLSDRRQGAARVLWLPCLAVFAFGFFKTQSRGGLLALMAGVGMFVRLRYGWRQLIVLGLVGLPGVLALGGRQSELSLGAGTGQERMYLWAEGLRMFRESPLFGIGWGQYALEVKQVAHNTYINVLTELGMFGGVFFMTACYLGFTGLYRLALPEPPARGGGQPTPRQILDPEMARLYPYLAAAFTAYATGMLTLSLSDRVPTYTFLAMASVFQGLAQTRPPTPAQRFDLGLLIRMVGLCILFLGAMYVFLRLGMRV